jgi:hypothetical protein
MLSRSNSIILLVLLSVIYLGSFAVLVGVYLKQSEIHNLQIMGLQNSLSEVLLVLDKQQVAQSIPAPTDSGLKNWVFVLVGVVGIGAFLCVLQSGIDVDFSPITENVTTEVSSIVLGGLTSLQENILQNQEQIAAANYAAVASHNGMVYAMSGILNRIELSLSGDAGLTASQLQLLRDFFSGVN